MAASASGAFPRIMSAAFSAIISVAACVFARVIVGITEASTTRSPSIPWTRSSESTTAPFWIEGFKMGDDEGWLEFFDWPPTGDKSEVTPTGDDLDWAADSGEEAGEFHFLNGPYQLAPGHYRVEAYTEDGHPNGGGHFAKAKMFWVDPCEQNGGEHMPCPPDVSASASSDGDILVDWSAVEGAVSYNVYRAVGEGDFEFVTTVTDTEYLDTDTENGVTYSYIVTAFDGEEESRGCDSVEATAIPFFPSLAAGALAIAGSVGAFAIFRRRT